MQKGVYEINLKYLKSDYKWLHTQNGNNQNDGWDILLFRLLFHCIIKIFFFPYENEPNGFSYLCDIQNTYDFIVHWMQRIGNKKLKSPNNYKFSISVLNVL